MSSIEAYVGDVATAGAARMGARAYATGNRIAFAGEPDLHTAAHEAAHVVQQRSGVQLAGGVDAAGDSYERHADAVADLVVQNQSAEPLLNQHAGGASSPRSTASGAPVQRKIGFEFEAGNVVSTSGEFGGNLAKKDRLLRGDGFTVEADDLGYSDVEFVTDAFDETKAGEQRAVATVNRIVNFTKQADARYETLLEEQEGKGKKQRRTGNMSIRAMRDFGTPVPNRYFRPGSWGAQVQVTAGILIGKLDSVLEKLAAMPQPETEAEQEHKGEVGADEVRPFEPRFGLEMETSDQESEGPQSRKGKEKTQCRTVPEDSEADEQTPLFQRPMQSSTVPLLSEQTTTDTSSLVNRDPDVGRVLPTVRTMLEADGFPSQLAGLISMLALYLVRGARGVPEYGKTISGPLMARTDFATIFALLPDPLQQYFKRRPEEFVGLVTRAAGTAMPEANFAETQPIYTGGLYNADGHEAERDKQPDMSGLTIGTWLRNLVGPVSVVPHLLKRLIGTPKGVDRLTARHFPGGSRARTEIESLGGYGAKTDRRGGSSRLFGGGPRMPIFEFRGLPELPPERWVDFAREFHRMIVAVNRR